MKKMLFVLLTFLSFSLSTFAGVNLNTATQAELETIDGIGPVKAQAIIDYRKKNSGFKSVDELEKVDGIGAVTLKRVRKDVSISGKTTAVAPTDSRPSKVMKTTKSAKEAKSDTKSVGTEKAADSGKTADVKVVKVAKPKVEEVTSKTEVKTKIKKE